MLMNTTSTYGIELPGSVKRASVSFAQQRLWFLQQWNPKQPQAITAFMLQIDEPLDQEALEQSIQTIVQRHEILCTTFDFLDGQLTQSVAPSLTLPFPVYHVPPLPEEKWVAEAQRKANEMALQPFDLAHGPLMRIALLHGTQERHALLVVAHQLIFDAQSTAIFLRELAALYQTHTTHQPSSLPTLPIHYTDFTLQQQAWVNQDTLAPHLAYWKHLLQYAPTTLDLPTNHAPHTSTITTHEVYPFVLPKELTHALNTLCQQEEVSLFGVLLAAFSVLLSRYSGQEDLCIGTTSTEHSWPNTANLIGNFTNTLVMRADLAGDPTFLGLLARMKQVTTAVHEHAMVPFEEVIKALHPQRLENQSPFFRVFFELEPSPSILPTGWSLHPVYVPTGRDQCDLSLILIEHPEGLRGYLKYRPDLFDAATIERMVGHWLTVLDAATKHPTKPVTLLPIITKRERHQLIEAWNATQAPYPQETPLHHLFEQQVARTPDAIAISFAEQHLTYDELNRRANRLAHLLRKQGVGPDTLVGIFVERSLEMVVGLLGILKAGGAYVPLDPTYPSERIAYMLEDAQVATLVTQSHLQSHLPTHTASVICLDTDTDTLERFPPTNPTPLSTASHLAYVIYTSGSTGRPKGVQICHRSLVNFLSSMRKEPGLTAEDRLLAVTTLSFDIAGLELYLPLITGAQVIIASTVMASDGNALAQMLLQKRITIMQATPITWRILLASGWQGSPHLRIFCGGEALPFDLAQQLLPRVASLWNLYGPTETTIWSTVNKITLQDERISIGRPIANTELYVLDTHLQLLPVGVPGELFIGGDGLARGYLHRPELTQERFIAHPFSDEPNARLYRTGDLASYQPDGTVVILGRLDHQVKVRGFRIELGEIETVLGRHPGVQHTVVIVREATAGDSRLVAYVVPQAHARLSSEELHQHARKHLPAYMLPSTFILMEAFPLTPNGKIDRRALPAPEASQWEEKSSYVAPKSFFEQQLVTLWEELLQVHPIGIHDNFFEVGGHSLLAMRLIERIEKGSGKKLALSTLFAEATIEQLARAIQQDESDVTFSQTRTPVLAVQTSGTQPPFFFLHGQWEGGAFYCLELARALGPNQPFYLLEPYRFTDMAIPPSIEEMASAHIEAMRQIQPEGPYRFGGWCNGGLIAYEMARQLSTQGQQVELLVLMDADAPAFRFRRERRLIEQLVPQLHIRREKQVDWFLLYRHLRIYFYHWRKQQQARRHTQPAPVPPPEEAQHQQETEVFAAEASLPPALFPNRKALRQDWLGIYEWAVAGYLPSAYCGKMTFFWTQEEPQRKTKWRPWTAGKELDIHMVPGNHITSRTRYLSVLADHLRQCVQVLQKPF